jgi:hypothetical protein
MEEEHPFSIKILADPLNAHRSRWAIYEGIQILMRSPYSYATRREAEKDAGEALQRVELRRLLK